MMTETSAVVASDGPEETVRTYFPETWIWDLVPAEGTQETVSHNALLCPAEGPVEKDISLKLPEVFVVGSAKASLSVLDRQV
ncbi:unnamed protein product [Coregonus sp. 'balchen']|nr:unnamed protein product [Coregonus sp. 'balchen']